MRDPDQWLVSFLFYFNLILLNFILFYFILFYFILFYYFFSFNIPFFFVKIRNAFAHGQVVMGLNDPVADLARRRLLAAVVHLEGRLVVWREDLRQALEARGRLLIERAQSTEAREVRTAEFNQLRQAIQQNDANSKLAATRSQRRLEEVKEILRRLDVQIRRVEGRIANSRDYAEKIPREIEFQRCALYELQNLQEDEVFFFNFTQGSCSFFVRAPGSRSLELLCVYFARFWRRLGRLPVGLP